MLAVYVLVAVALTMPLALHFSTHVPGARIEGLDQDGYVFLWDYWWVRWAVTHPGLHVMSTRYLFWPHEVSLHYHTLALLHSAAAGLLQGAISLIQSYNLLLLLSLAGCAWGAFLLCRYITGSAPAAAVAGLAFGFCPYLTTHALAHQNLIAAEWLAPFAYCALRGLRERRARHVIGAAASWALVGLCDWYYFLYAAMLLGVLAVCEVAARPRRWAGAAIATIGIAALTTAALWPVLGPMLAERAQGAYMQQPLARAAALGSQPGLFLTPAFTHPLFGAAATRVLHSHGYSRGEATLYLGLMVIALALTGVAFRRRQLTPWAAAAAFFLIMALGTHLRLGRTDQFNLLAVLLAGGLPGNGFDLPLSAGLSSQLATAAIGGSPLTVPTEISLPYLWLWEYLPITRLAAVPTRAALPAMLCLVVLAAGGLAAVMQSVRPRWRGAVAGIAAAVVLFEFIPAPYPLRPLPVPEVYRKLARTRGTFAVAEVPLYSDIMVYMYYQTTHHKPILLARLSRQQPQAMTFVRDNALLRDFQPEPGTFPHRLELRLTRQGALTRGLPELRAAYQPALAELRANRVDVILAHTEMMQPADIAALNRVLTDALGLTATQEGPTIVAYSVSPDHSYSR